MKGYATLAWQSQSYFQSDRRLCQKETGSGTKVAYVEVQQAMKTKNDAANDQGRDMQGREHIMTMATVSHTMTRLVISLGLILVAGGAWALLQEVLATVLR